MTPNDADVDEFLAGITKEQQRTDADELIALMTEVTGEPAVMWGPSIIGFGGYHYRYDSGREGDAPLVGFSPRSQALAIYLIGGYQERYAALLKKLGPHKPAKGCLYVKRLADVDLGILRQLIERTVRVHRGADAS